MSLIKPRGPHNAKGNLMDPSTYTIWEFYFSEKYHLETSCHSKRELAEHWGLFKDQKDGRLAPPDYLEHLLLCRPSAVVIRSGCPFPARKLLVAQDGQAQNQAGHVVMLPFVNSVRHCGPRAMGVLQQSPPYSCMVCIFSFSLSFIHSFFKRPGWMGFWAAWWSGWQPCLWQGAWT